MIGPDGNNSDKQATAVQPDKDETAQEPVRSSAPPNSPLFATRGKQSPKQQLSQNKPALIGAGAVVFALLIFVFTSAHKHQHFSAGKIEGKGHPTAPSPSPGNTDSQKSFFPVTNSDRPAANEVNNGRIDEQDVQRTATRQAGQATSASSGKIPQSASLGSLPPFDNAQGAWQAPPYQPTNGSDANNELPKPDKETDQPSLVFVQKLTQTNSNKTVDSGTADTGLGLGLPTGTRLRARLEVAASTAVRTPVIAVVEYNYERDGEIIIPAGAKAFGHIEQADRSGYMSIRFDSMLMPDGASTAIEAVATDMGLRPLKGKVEGKNTGKNALVRSLSGVGQVGALFAGRSGSLSQPFSEGDLIRERFSTNIGETADQEVTRLALSEHVVVSISANTPIYVVLDHGTKSTVTNNASPLGRSPAPSQNQDAQRQLLQLLQLQRELNETPDASQHP